MVRKLIATGAVVVLLAACGASINGPANSNAGDRCGGHLDCGEVGCCMGANQDGAGWSCNLPGSARPCTFVGLSPDPNGSGEFSAPKPAATPTSDAPDEPPPVRHDGRG